ncbi:helix-turn-helix domain-containing protein [Lederbergia galactosidilytica]|uniref:HTH cro/C1-type domain-containing protein n=1 Tax=Lederbergia galactosidilytica TaxID=217031 RepID=A0A177ZXK1_9BACI|nr:helix-turn-helix transcriptional regulator [Lederbergia galactosidilytica]OAK72657.1 hypothetical protein ABB05_07310 [Lederbergia galactosidilytica]
MDTGKRIVSLREKRGWSQRELAKRVDLNASVMNRIESGERPIKDVELDKIATILDVSTDYLLGRTDKDTREKTTEEIYEDPDFQYAMRSAQGLSEESKQKVFDFIEMMKEVEKARNNKRKNTK